MYVLLEDSRFSVSPMHDSFLYHRKVRPMIQNAPRDARFAQRKMVVVTTALQRECALRRTHFKYEEVQL